MDIEGSIAEDLLFLLPMLNAIGYMLKTTPRIKDWLIPYILCFIGIITTVSLKGFNVLSVAQGIIVSMSSVGIHQVIKQSKGKEGE